MTWQSKADPGIAAVAQYFETMKIEPEWIVSQPRGFTWWSGEFKQKIWADDGIYQHSDTTYRIHAETDFLLGRGKCQTLSAAMFGAIDHETMSGVVYSAEDDTYRLCCSVHLDMEHAQPLSHIFLSAACLQAIEANNLAHHLARTLNAVPAASEHPLRGMRPMTHPMLNAAAQFFKPMGAPPSRWEGGTEWDELFFHIERLAHNTQSDKHSFLEGEFPIPDKNYTGHKPVMRLAVDSRHAHPDLGYGLHIVLRMPYEMDLRHGADVAIQLNGLEREEWRRSQFLGSWGLEEGKLEFTTFVPNTCYMPGIMSLLAVGMCIRAEWMQDHHHLVTAHTVQAS